MPRPTEVVLYVVAVPLAAATAFFTYYGAILVYMALTFEGEGSLGHVGMYVAALLFPFLALLFGLLTALALKNARRAAG